MTHSVLLVAVAGLVTLALRAAPFLVLSGERKTPEFISYLGRVLPSAVMGMLVIYCLRNLGFEELSLWLPQLLCCGVVVLVHVLKRSTLLSILSGILAVIMIIATVFVGMFDNTVALFVANTFWELENEDPNAVYYKEDFASQEDRVAKGYELVKQVEGEGAALLYNENGALPLDKGASVSLFSTSSVNIVYGGTGSANVDSTKADTLKSALEKAEFKVNTTLWDFYLTGDGSQFVRDSGGFTSSAAVGEAPVDAYTEDVLGSVKSYGDAAIVTLSRVGGEGADLEFITTNYLALDDNEKAMMQMLKDLKDKGDIKKIIVLINSSNPLQVDFMKNNEYSVDSVLWIGGVGISGINAVADILAGDINPSGGLVDTYCYDNYSSPAMKNFIPTVYEGYTEGVIPANASTYMIYKEGIYVGYK